jgi:hypothetical protein
LLEDVLNGHRKKVTSKANKSWLVTAYVPKPMTSGAKADGRFNNDVFIYDAAKNEYICPAGEALIWRYSYVEKGLKLHRYRSSKCRGCAMKPHCTPSTERRVRRWEHETVLEEMQDRLSNAPEMMRIRKRTVEHPFGTLKQWMGATHFLTRKLNGVSAEMSLNVLAYNLKRVMKIIGTTGLLNALTAYSTPMWTPIPRTLGQRFHAYLDTHSMDTWTLIPRALGQ